MNTISLQYLSLCFFFTVLFLSLCTIFCIWIWSAPLAMNYFSSDILIFLHVLGPSYGFLYSRSLTTIMPVTNVNVALDKPARLSFSCSLDLLLISDQTNICRDIREGKCTWCCICLPLNACPCGLESVPSGYPNPTRYPVFLSIPDPIRFSFRTKYFYSEGILHRQPIAVSDIFIYICLIWYQKQIERTTEASRLV